MIDNTQVEKLARTLENAWAISYRGAPGSNDRAETLLSWLERFRLPLTSRLHRELETVALSEEPPVAVSSCAEAASMRWYVRQTVVFGYDSAQSSFVIPESELAGAPDVPREGDTGDLAPGSPYEYLV